MLNRVRAPVQFIIYAPAGVIDMVIKTFFITATHAEAFILDRYFIHTGAKGSLDAVNRLFREEKTHPRDNQKNCDRNQSFFYIYFLLYTSFLNVVIYPRFIGLKISTPASEWK